MKTQERVTDIGTRDYLKSGICIYNKECGNCPGSRRYEGLTSFQCIDYRPSNKEPRECVIFIRYIPEILSEASCKHADQA